MYHYFTLTGNYLCTDNYHCPKEANLIIENLNKCTYDCSYDNNYHYSHRWPSPKASSGHQKQRSHSCNFLK